MRIRTTGRWTRALWLTCLIACVVVCGEAVAQSQPSPSGVTTGTDRWPTILGVSALVRDFSLIVVAILGVGWTVRARREHDRRIAFAGLHARQIEVIAELYRRLSESERLLDLTKDLAPAHAELLKRMGPWGESANAMRAYFQDNRIWLDENTCTKMDAFWAALKAAGWAQSDFLAMMTRDRNVEPQDAEFEKKYQAPYDTASKVAEAKSALESQLRAILYPRDGSKA